MSIPSADRIPTEPLCRVAAAVALAAVAVIHVVDLPDTLDETPLIAYGYLALIAAALFAATLLLTTPSRWAWGLAGAIGAGAIFAYVLSRTTGLPTDADDIGNWDCALGTAAVSVEALLVLLAAWRIRPRHVPSGPPRSDATAPLELAG